MLKFIHALAIATLFGQSLCANDWPQFRGPTADGVSSAKDVPTHWSAQEQVAWKTPIPGDGWSSPVLAAGKLYLTTAVTDDESGNVSLRAVCIGATDGQVLWNVEVFQPEQSVAQQKHTKNARASSTPVVTDDRLFVHFGHMGTAALDLTGKVVWRQEEIQYRPVHGNGGSPALVDDVLVFSCDGAADPFVAALAQADGAVRWKVPRNTSAAKTFSFSTPLILDIDGVRQVVSAGSGFVGAYDPQDGREAAKFGASTTAKAIPSSRGRCSRMGCCSLRPDSIAPAC
jgi:outer membrane protein assembly factor BamB